MTHPIRADKNQCGVGSASADDARFDRIHQLALVGRAALNTNLSHDHIGLAVAELLKVIEETIESGSELGFD